MLFVFSLKSFPIFLLDLSAYWFVGICDMSGNFGFCFCPRKSFLRVVLTYHRIKSLLPLGLGFFICELGESGTLPRALSFLLIYHSWLDYLPLCRWDHKIWGRGITETKKSFLHSASTFHCDCVWNADLWLQKHWLLWRMVEAGSSVSACFHTQGLSQATLPKLWSSAWVLLYPLTTCTAIYLHVSSKLTHLFLI